MMPPTVQLSPVLTVTIRLAPSVTAPLPRLLLLPALLSVKSPFHAMGVAVAITTLLGASIVVPALIVNVPVPIALLLPRYNVPVLSVMPPVKVLEPLSRHTPLPFFTIASLPPPEPSPMLPEMTFAPVFEPLSVSVVVLPPVETPVIAPMVK
jgi:hypothetical protein